MMKYGKAIVALAVPIIGWGLQQFGVEIGSETLTEWLVILLTAAGVYQVANT